MGIAAILMVGFLSALAEIPKLIKSKKYKELAVFSGFLLASIGFYSMSNLGLLPNVSKMIETMIKSMIKIKFSYQ